MKNSRKLYRFLGMAALLLLLFILLPVPMLLAGTDDIPPSPVIDLVIKAGDQTGTVDLFWHAPGDDATTGQAAAYTVRYNTAPITPDNWDASTEVSGPPTPSLAGRLETMRVSGLTPGQKYYFAVRATDEAGNLAPLSNYTFIVLQGEEPKLDHSAYLPLVASNNPNPAGYIIPDTTKVLSPETLQYLTSIEKIPAGETEEGQRRISGQDDDDFGHIDESLCSFFADGGYEYETVFQLVITDTTDTGLQAIEELESLQVGDIIVAGVTEETPNGFLCKIQNIEDTSYDTYYIYAVGASLEEAIQQGGVELGEIDLSGAKTEEKEGVELIDIAGPKFTWKLNEVKIGPKNAFHKATLNGIVEFAPSASFNLDIEGFALQEMTFVIKGEHKAEITLTGAPTLAPKKTYQKHIASVQFKPYVVYIGPVPLVLTPRLDVYVGVTGAINGGTIKTSIVATASLEAGVDYEKGRNPEWEGIFEPRKGFQFNPPELETGLEVEAYVKPKLSLPLYGAAGPHGGLKGYLNLKATENIKSQAKEITTSFNVVLKGGLKGVIGAEMQVLGQKIGDFSAEGEIFETTLFSATLPNNPPVVKRAEKEGDSNTNQSLESNLAWTGVGAAATTPPIYLGWIGYDPDGDRVTYDVYFEAENNPPTTLASEAQDSTLYLTGDLITGTRYYWQVIARDEHGATTVGPVWSFVGGETPGGIPPNTPTNPSPADGAVDQPLALDLSWSGDDPFGESVTYDVYFGSTNPPSLVATDHTTVTYSTGTLSPTTTYYWQIMTEDQYGISAFGPVWSFTTSTGNAPPNTPTGPSPAAGAIDQPLALDLSWSGGDPDGDSVTYDVYLGDTNPPSLVATDHTTNAYSTGTLSPTTTYYWQIIARDQHGLTTTGSIWSFTTLTPNDAPNTPTGPSPADGDIDQSLALDLSWSGGDPDGDSVTYDVYLGDTNPPSLVATDHTTVTYSTGTLSPATTYYWQIIARDQHGLTTTGSIWSFTTGEPSTTRVSVATDGIQGYGTSGGPAISADGRYVAFESYATNLVPGDTNGYVDIFVHDRDTGQTTRVSVASDGSQADEDVLGDPSISADGRFVAFYSLASLVPDDTNNDYDIFVHDRDVDEDGIFDEPGQIETRRVSIYNDGSQAESEPYAPAISADGRYVAFASRKQLTDDDTNSCVDVFVHDLQTSQNSLVSVDSDGNQGDLWISDETYSVAISADGRYVSFDSVANNLVPGDTGDDRDIFGHDRDVDEDGIFDEPGQIETRMVSVATDGTYGNDHSWDTAISADGRYVAFYSEASNLVSGDTNGKDDIFVHDWDTGQTSRVSVASDGTQANNDSGHCFSSACFSISADGRYVAFGSGATNLVPGDTNGVVDPFVHDRDVDEDGIFDEPGQIETSRVSVAFDGTQGSGDDPAISANGRYVAFESSANNLVPGDTNGVRDVFVRQRW